jgi:hypothetical protein
MAMEWPLFMRTQQGRSGERKRIASAADDRNPDSSSAPAGEGFDFGAVAS